MWKKKSQQQELYMSCYNIRKWFDRNWEISSNISWTWVWHGAAATSLHPKDNKCEKWVYLDVFLELWVKYENYLLRPQTMDIEKWMHTESPCNILLQPWDNKYEKRTFVDLTLTQPISWIRARSCKRPDSLVIWKIMNSSLVKIRNQQTKEKAFGKQLSDEILIPFLQSQEWDKVIY